MFWPFTVWIKCSRPSASNFKSFSRSLEQFFLTVGQDNFRNKWQCSCQLHKYSEVSNFKSTNSLKRKNKKFLQSGSTRFLLVMLSSDLCLYSSSLIGTVNKQINKQQRSCQYIFRSLKLQIHSLKREKISFCNQAPHDLSSSCYLFWRIYWRIFLRIFYEFFWHTEGPRLTRFLGLGKNRVTWNSC